MQEVQNFLNIEEFGLLTLKRKNRLYLNLLNEARNHGLVVKADDS